MKNLKQDSLAIKTKIQRYKKEFFCHNKCFRKMPKKWLLWDKTAKLSNSEFVLDFKTVWIASGSCGYFIITKFNFLGAYFINYVAVHN